MKVSRALAITVLIAASEWSYVHAQSGASGVVTESAPVMLLPDANRTPLTTLRAGTPVRVLDREESGWHRISFKDPNLGEREGYVRTQHLRVATTAPAPEAPAAATPAAAEARPSPESAHTAAAAPAVAPNPPPAIPPSAPTPSTAPPRLNGLSADAVMAAIITGQRQRGRLQGLQLIDSGQSWANALASMGNNPSATGTTGFRLEIFTPITWVRQLASQAAKEYRQFGMDDLTEEMTAPVLRVTAYPDTPTVVTARGILGSSSVQHVVLRSEDKRIVIQPLTKEPFTEETSNAMGGKVVHEGLMLTFGMDDLRELRGPRGDREFFITVIGATGEEKNFKVKKKHFDDLGER